MLSTSLTRLLADFNRLCLFMSGQHEPWYYLSYSSLTGKLLCDAGMLQILQ